MTHEAYWVTVASITPVIGAAAVVAIERVASDLVGRVDQLNRKLRALLLVGWLWWVVTIVGLALTELVALTALRTDHTPNELWSTVCSGALGGGVVLGLISGASTSVISGFFFLLGSHAIETNLRIRIWLFRRDALRRFVKLSRMLDLAHAQLSSALLSPEIDKPERESLQTRLRKVETAQRRLGEDGAADIAELEKLSAKLDTRIRRKLHSGFGTLFPITRSADPTAKQSERASRGRRPLPIALEHSVTARRRSTKRLAGHRRPLIDSQSTSDDQNAYDNGD